MEVGLSLAEFTRMYPPPAPPEVFVDRAAEIRALSEWDASQRPGILAIVGAAGTGKTALACKYAERAALGGRAVVWLSRGAAGALPEELSRLRGALTLCEEPVLIVFDEHDDLRVPSDLVGVDSSHVLVTTRNAREERAERTIVLGELPLADAIELLAQRLPAISHDDARRVVERLGALPLAVDLSARLITGSDVSGFLRALDASEEGDDAESAADQVLEVPEVQRARTSYQEGAALLERGQYARARSHLQEASEVLSERLGPESPDALAARFTLADAMRLSGRPTDAVAILEDLLMTGTARGDSDATVLRVRVALASALRDLGDVHRAIALLDEALPQLEGLLGPRHPQVIQAKSSLAVLYSDIGELTRSVNAQREVVEAARETLGRESQVTLAAASNLASTLSELGDLEGARRLQQEVLEASEGALGADHPDTLTAASNLASTLYRQGRPEAALPLEQTVLTKRESVLGPAHPDTLEAANNLAFTLSALGRPEESYHAITRAVSGYRELALEDPEVILPHLARSLTKQAVQLAELARPTDALAAIDEAVAIYRRLAAADADYLPDLARTLNNQSVQLSEVGRLEEAVAAIGEAVALVGSLSASRPERFLPDLAHSLSNQAMQLRDLKRPQDALAASEQAVMIYRQLAGAHPDSFLPDLARALDSKSAELSELGDTDAALRAADEAVGICRQLSDARPDAFLPDLAATLSSRDKLLRTMGRTAEADTTQREIAAIRDRLAEDRPDVVMPQLRSPDGGREEVSLPAHEPEEEERGATLLTAPDFEDEPAAGRQDLLEQAASFPGNIAEELTSDTLELGFPSVLAVPSPVDAPRVYCVVFPILLVTRPHRAFNRLEVAASFSSDEFSAESPTVLDILPSGELSSRFPAGRTFSVAVATDNRYVAGAADLAARQGSSLTVASDSGGDTGIVLGPWPYRLAAARIQHSGVGLDRVFWRVDGARFQQEDDPGLRVLLQVPAASTRVRVVVRAVATRYFSLMDARQQDAVRRLPTALRSFFSRGTPIAAESEWDLQLSGN